MVVGNNKVRLVVVLFNKEMEMKKRLILSLLAALVLFVQGVTFAQVTDRMTPQQIFDRCGAACDPAVVATTVSKSGIHAAQAEPDAPIAMLRVVGGQIVGTSAKVYVDIVRDLPEVWIAGRVSYIVDGSVVPNKAFYVGKDISLTRYGPGLFPGLSAGAVIPIGEVYIGNAGDEAYLQLVFYEQGNGRPIRTVSTRLWSRIRPTRSVPPRVQVNSVQVVDGTTMIVNGTFLRGIPLTIEVGDPDWDSGFAFVVPDSDKVLRFRIPQGKTGSSLYPNGWDGEISWSLVLAMADGECFSFPGALRVRGDYNRTGVFPVQ